MPYQLEARGNTISKYNDAQLSVMRLHEHWVKAEHYANTGRLLRWKFILDSVWREIYPDIIKKKLYQYIKKNNILKDRLTKCKTKSEFYEQLNRRHEFMRMVQNKVGKGSVYIDEYESDIE